MNEKIYLTRVEASEYINECGLPCTKTTLAKLACLGGGPAFRKFGSRVVYTKADLDAWMSEKLSPAVRSTSELP